MAMGLPILTVNASYSRGRGAGHATLVSEFEGGSRRTRSRWPRKKQRFSLVFANLSSADASTLWNFYLGRKGAALLFYIKDYRDYQVTDEAVGTGDGSQTQFQLDKKFIVENTDVIKVGGVTKTRGVDYTINNDTGVITFSSAPGNGLAITATYEFYYRCSFEQDNLELAEFLYLRDRGQLTLIERFDG